MDKSEIVTFWIDQNIGKDTNNGSLVAPFATMKALERFQSSENGDFIVQFSPGEYVIEGFHFVNSSSWRLIRCEICPYSSIEAQNTVVKFSMVPPVSTPLSNFFSLPSRTNSSKEGLISFKGIQFAPNLNTAQQAASFGIIFNLTSGASLSIEDCSVSGFYFQKDTLNDHKGLIVARRNLVLQNSQFYGNRMGTEDSSLILGGLIADCLNCTIGNSSFFNNSLIGSYLWGGLFKTFDASFSDSVFRNNSGSISMTGVGLAIATYPWSRSLVLENTTFHDNQFTHLDYEEITIGAAVFARPYGLRFSISNSSFTSNSASMGTCIAIMDVYWLEYGGIQPEEAPRGDGISNRIDLFNLLFDENEATSGVGVSTLIQGISRSAAGVSYLASQIEKLTMTNIRVFNSMVPPRANLPSLASDLILPSTTIDISYVFGEIIASNISIRGDPPQFSKDAFVPAMRFRIQKSQSMTINRLIFNGFPNLDKGGFLLVQSVVNAEVYELSVESVPSVVQAFHRPSKRSNRRFTTNEHFNPLIDWIGPKEVLSDARRSTSSDDVLASWNLFCFEKYPQRGWNEFDVKISGLYLKDLELQSTTVLLVRSVDVLKLNRAKLENLMGSSPTNNNTAPFIVISSITNAIFISDSVFRSLSSLISISADPGTILIHDVEIIDVRNAISPGLRIDTNVNINIAIHDVISKSCTGPLISLYSSSSKVEILNMTVSDVIMDDGATGSVFKLDSPFADHAHQLFNVWRIERSEFMFNTATRGGVLSSMLPLTLDVVSSQFVGNSASDSGGVFWMAESSHLRIFHSEFRNNQALQSGGVAFIKGDVHSWQTNFKQNSAASGSGGSFAIFSTPKMKNGHIRTSFTPSEIAPTAESTFSHSNFISNDAKTFGGAIYADADDLDLLLMHNCTFDSNTAATTTGINRPRGQGGAIYSGRNTSVSSSTFDSNVVLGYGGAIVIFSPFTSRMTPLTLYDSQFVDNQADNGGGAIYFTVPDNVHYVASAEWAPAITNTLFIGNIGSAIGGGAIFSVLPISFTSSRNVSFIGNQARRGAAIYLQRALCDLKFGHDFSFYNNSASCCGAVSFFGSIADPGIIDQPHTIMRGNVAEWGVVRGTATLNLSAVILPSTPSFPDKNTTILDESNNNVTIPLYFSYPGVKRVIGVRGTDQFGQHISTRLHAMATFTCVSGGVEQCSKLHFTSQSAPGAAKTGSYADLITFTFTFDDAFVPSFDPPISGYITVTESTSMDPVQPIRIAASLTDCGAGYGHSKAQVFDSISSTKSALEMSYVCELCPLFHYSFNGTCSLCPFDPGVQSCTGADVISPATWWIYKDVKINRYQSLRCAESYCGVGNRCLLGRTGTLCGECVAGRYQSITSICVDCARPNWVMIVLVFFGLWITVLILHSMLAVSSGKATILIFFVQTAWAIRSQIPVVSSTTDSLLSSNSTAYRVLSWILCLWPMDYVQRKLILALVPLLMMAQLTLTFGIYHLIKCLLGCSRKKDSRITADKSKESELWIEPILIGDDGPAYEGKGENSEAESTTSLFPHSSSEASLMGLNDLDDSSSDLEVSTSDQVGETDAWISEFETEPGTILEAKDEYNMLLFEDRYNWQVQSAYFHHYRYIRTMLALFANSFSSVLGVVLSTVGCIELLNGRRLLAQSPAISCDSSQIPSALYYVGIPWLLIVTITILVKLLHGHFTRSLSVTDVRFGVWYEMYKPRFFAWKLTEFVRRTLVALIGNLFIADRTTRASILCTIMICSLTIQTAALPYKHALENTLETLSLLSLSFIAVLVFWYAQMEPEAEWPATASLVVFIIVTIGLLLAFGTTLIKRLIDRRRKKIRNQVNLEPEKQGLLMNEDD